MSYFKFYIFSGICIDALWLRLNDRPKFPLTLDDKSKAYLWRIVCVRTDLAFYELPIAREELVLSNRFKHTDKNTGIFLEQVYIDNSYKQKTT